LKARRVLIKDLSPTHPMLENCLRVTIGTPDENRRFLIALDESLREAV
jgi:histidinol-phosphate aminotransferase